MSVQRGRPPRSSTKADRRVVILFTEEEVAEIDRLRGDRSRAEFLRNKALEGRDPDPTPETQATEVSPPSFTATYTDDLSSDVYGVDVFTLAGDWTHDGAAAALWRPFTGSGNDRMDVRNNLRNVRDQKYATRAAQRAKLGLETPRSVLLDLSGIGGLSSWGERILYDFAHESVDGGYRVALRTEAPLAGARTDARLAGLKLLLQPISKVHFFESTRRKAVLWLYQRDDWETTP